MRITRLRVRNYRSIHEQTLDFDDLNFFIGANASGKSTILDALRFLHDGAKRGFEFAVAVRGGMVHLAWKGQPFQTIDLEIELTDGLRNYEWKVSLERQGYDFLAEERSAATLTDGAPPNNVLESQAGRGWWWSGDKGRKVEIAQSAMACALTAASADASFPGRKIADFVRRWGFFDPSPYLLRHDSARSDSNGLDPHGRNLAKTLYTLRQSAPDVFRRVVGAARSILGVPEKIEPRENDGRFYFVQNEPGLQFPVHQMGASSGTLRLLALMVALHASSETRLIGMEEPENYVHPAALDALVQQIVEARDRVQFVVTTHSPLVLDCLDRPGDVGVVHRDEVGGTVVNRETDAEGVRKALRESGFGLGEYYETKGFGVV